MSHEPDEQFLIPPPPPGIAPTTTHDEPATVSIDEVDMIELPPGIVDSGTYRMPSPRSAEKPGSLDNAPLFFPVAVPGLPPELPTVGPTVPLTADQSSAPVTAPSRLVSAPSGTVDDATVASVGRPSLPSWRLVLPTGQQYRLDRNTVIGRDPANIEPWTDAAVLAVADPGKSVSKTHAALEFATSGQLLAHDLNSTNGVYLSYEREDVTVEPGSPVVVESGAELVCGQFAILLERD